MKKLNYLLIIGLFLVFACNSSTESNGDDTNDMDIKDTKKTENLENIEKLEKLEAESNNDTKKGKYKVESCIIDYEMNMGAMKTNTVLSFKDYGLTERTETSVDIMGKKSTTRMVKKDDFTYSFQVGTKNGTKMSSKNSNTNFIPLDYESLPAEKKALMKELGNEDIAGKSCKIIQFNDKGTDGKIWIWNNIVLKYEIKTNGQTISVIAVKVQDSPSFADDFFEIPSDIEFKEVDLTKMLDMNK